MKRDISFRGKTIYNEWKYGFLTYRKGGISKTAHLISSAFLIRDIEEDVCYEIDWDTTGQYIGIDDKNGNKIFEDDYVLCTREYDDGNILNIIVLIEDIRNLPRDLFGSSLKCLEVVGNIYDNPDFLKNMTKVEY